MEGAARPRMAATPPAVGRRALSGGRVPGRCQAKTVCDPFVAADTYWYLSASPELMTLAAERLDARFGAQP